MHRLFTLTSTLALLLVPAAAQADDLFAVDLAVGRDHACQVTSCGDVECWGRNDHGQAASKDYASGQVMLAGSAPWEEVTVGRLHTCALDGNGRAACWGNNSLGQLDRKSVV